MTFEEAIQYRNRTCITCRSPSLRPYCESCQEIWDKLAVELRRLKAR